MCNLSCLRFGNDNLTRAEITGKRVIEIGSYDVNGSLRSYVRSLRPAQYVGVDIEKGYGVDVVCTAEGVRERFRPESFDVVLSTELMEHVRDWKKVISNMKQICKPEGIILITTRSHGYPYHGWPYDFWRFEQADLKAIFSDFEIRNLEKDGEEPGVFIKARKPSLFVERDLTDLELYSIVSNGRVREIDEVILQAYLEKHAQQYRLLERQTVKGKVRKLLRDLYWQVTNS